MSGEKLTPNFNSRTSGTAWKELSESLETHPDAIKLAEDEINGTLDDNVDIAEPNYNEAETEKIEQKLAQADGIDLPPATSLPEDPVLETESTTFAIEDPNNPNPY